MKQRGGQKGWGPYDSAKKKDNKCINKLEIEKLGYWIEIPMCVNC